MQINGSEASLLKVNILCNPVFTDMDRNKSSPPPVLRIYQNRKFVGCCCCERNKIFSVFLFPFLLQISPKRIPEPMRDKTKQKKKLLQLFKQLYISLYRF